MKNQLSKLLALEGTNLNFCTGSCTTAGARLLNFKLFVNLRCGADWSWLFKATYSIMDALLAHVSNICYIIKKPIEIQKEGRKYKHSKNCALEFQIMKLCKAPR